MKKVNAILVVVLLVSFALSGCAGNGAAPTPTPTQNEVSASPNGIEPTKAPANIELVIDSWRTDDAAGWENTIIPAYESKHPGVTVKFDPVVNTEYGTTLTTKLQANTAGDIIMAEPYDYRVSLYQEGYLAKLNDIKGLDANTDRYDEFALSAWSTDNGDLFALPLAAASHGFIYNRTMFDKLGLKAPGTIDEFFKVCDAIKAAGYTPITFGTADDFIANVYGYSLVAPQFTKGEEGRLGLINGTKKFTDPEFVAAWQFLEDWIPYLPDGFQAISYADMQNLFASEKTLIWPAGSWDIGVFNKMVGNTFERGTFQVPVQNVGDPNYVCFHPDNGLALNAKSPNKDAAIEFLQWTTTEEFAQLWNNTFPGFYTLSKSKVDISDPLSAQMLSWTTTAAGCSPRIAYQYISRGDFNADAEITRLTNKMFAGDITAQEAAEQMQAGFEAGYKPAAH